MSNPLPKVDQAIDAYYRQTEEENRLEQGAFLLESLRTRELISRHAPPPPAVVLDIGGAAGAYAFWLGDAGYSVHLLDPVERHIDEARQRNAAAQRPLASCILGDARALPFPDAAAEMVLLLGPLYHLTASEDRARALNDASRVLKPGGVLFAAGISRWASVLDGLSRDLFDDPAFLAIAEQDVKNGQHRNQAGRLDYFTTAYFHRPDDLRAEVATAGLQVNAVYGIEGPGWILPDISERLANSNRRENLLKAARMLDSEPSLAGASAHLLAVARKPH
jgi:ubiquinone/menaquinone biosynthesis C-methylase UbiE